MRFFIIQCIVILLSSCSKPIPERLLFRVEQRNISNDTITEYRFWDTGLVNTTILYGQKDLFSSTFQQLDKQTTQAAKDILLALQKLDYINDFPWKEDYYQRGDLIKVEFPDQVDLKMFVAKNDKRVTIAQTFYFYTGHNKQPQLSLDLQKLIASIPKSSSPSR
jgi:hypothetical protein